MKSVGRLNHREGRYLLLAMGGISYFCLMFIWFSLPAYLSPIIDELAISGTEAGILAGAVPLTYIPLALVTGIVIDRIGPRIGIGIAMGIFAVAQILRGLAPDFATMLVFTIGIGVGATGITFGLPKLVAELFPERWIGTASSVYLIMAALGSATAFGIGRPLLGPMVGGWRPLFIISGTIVLVYTLLWSAVAVWSVHSGIVGKTEKAGETKRFSIASIRSDVLVVVRHREMALLVVIGTMYLFLGHGLKGWLVTIFEARGVPAEIGGPITSLLILAQMVGVILIPALADRLRARRGALIGCGILCAIGPIGLVIGPTDVWLATMAVVVIGFGIGGLSPMIRAIPVQLEGVGPRLTGTAIGLIFAIGEIGGFFGPVLIGAIRDLTGTFDAGLLLFSIAGVIVIWAGFGLDL